MNKKKRSYLVKSTIMAKKKKIIIIKETAVRRSENYFTITLERRKKRKTQNSQEYDCNLSLAIRRCETELYSQKAEYKIYLYNLVSVETFSKRIGPLLPTS